MKDLVYLDENLLQQDMRLRLPKSILNNLNAIAGKSVFRIFLDPESKDIILRLVPDSGDEENA